LKLNKKVSKILKEKKFKGLNKIIEDVKKQPHKLKDKFDLISTEKNMNKKQLRKIKKKKK